MKSAREKSVEWLDLNVPGFDERFNAEDVASLSHLLKEQDRDTRHACAEAVNRIAGDNKTITYAHGVVMNTKAL